MNNLILEIAKAELINNSMLYYLLELQIGKAKAKRVYTKIFETVDREYKKKLKELEEILENERKHNNEKN